jgi:hypothetical protein
MRAPVRSFPRTLSLDWHAGQGGHCSPLGGLDTPKHGVYVAQRPFTGRTGQRGWPRWGALRSDGGATGHPVE